MLQGLYTSGSSMLARATRQEVVANNIANSDVPGYKRDGLFLRELGEARRKGSGVPACSRADMFGSRRASSAVTSSTR